MKNNVLRSLLIALIFGLLFQGANAQLHIAFQSIRDFPEDTATYRKIEKLFLNNEIDQARNLAYRFADSSLEMGRLSDFLFILNQTGANTFFVAKDMKKALQTWKYIEEKTKTHSDTVNIEYAIFHKYIATAYYYQYNDKKANEHYQRGLKIVQLLGVENSLTADFYVNIGNTYTNMGQYERALPYTEKAIASCKKNNNPHLLMLANQTYGYIASFRDVNLAIDFFTYIFEEADKLMIQESTVDKYRANIDDLLSQMYKKNRNYEKSLFHAQRAYKNLKKSGLPDLYLELLILNNLAVLSLSNELPDQTEKYLKKSFDLVDQSFGRTHVNAFPVFETAIRHHLSAQHTDSVRALISDLKNINIPEDAVSEKILYYLILGDFAKEQEHWDSALFFYKKAIMQHIPDFDPFRLLDSFPGLSLNHELFFKDLYPAMHAYESGFSKYTFSANKLADLKIKQAYLKFFTMQLEKYAFGIVLEKTGLDFSGKYQLIADKLISLSLEIYEQSKITEEPDELFEAISTTKSFYLKKQITDNQMRAANTENRAGWNEYLQLQKQLYQIENKIISANVSGKNDILDSLEKEILFLKFNIMNKQLQFEKDTDNIMPVFKKYRLAEVQNLLEEDEAIINYYFLPESLIVLCITKGQSSAIEIPEGDNINAAIQKYYKAIKTGAANLTYYADALSDYLIKPVMGQIEHKKHLIIIPDKNLFKIPFEPLTWENNKFLIEHKTICYHYSTTLWAFARENSIGVQEKSFLAFAPVFKKTATKENGGYRSLLESDFMERYYSLDKKNLEPLVHSAEEVKTIGSIFRENQIPTRIFINSEATERKFKNHVQQASIIHLATHGYVSQKYPGLSGFFFAEAKDDEEDGYLLAGEILNLELHANLVVLSTCNSGSGKIEDSEGILSLTRYLMYAGVPNIIATLWRVHDENTKKLMVQFYKSYMKGNTYAEAMQKAKLDCIKEGMIPMDWSGFVLIGN